jgi:hypothetical protein
MRQGGQRATLKSNMVRIRTGIEVGERLMHRRRILHYAAAGLLGWYLMVPPVSHTEQFQVDEHAPLGQWLVFEAFDNAKDCNDAQVRRESADKAKATANPKKTEQTVAPTP